MSAERMAQHFANMWGYYNLSFQPQALAWLDQQHGWLRQQVSARRPSARGSSDPAGAAAGEQEDSAFWAAQRLLLAQLDGMLEVSVPLALGVLLCERGVPRGRLL